ncbi:MAG: hypothetical protein ACOX8E_08165 [Ruminococcus sp.]|jgi:hypothetical protein
MLIPDELFRAARFHNSAQYSEYAGPIPAASSYMGGFQSHSSAIVRARADDGLFYPGINKKKEIPVVCGILKIEDISSSGGI